MLFVSFIIVNLFPSLVKVKSRLEAVFFIILPQILLHVYPWAQGERGGGGRTPDFKWRGWSNQLPKNIRRASNITPINTLNQTLTPKNPMLNFRALKNFQKCQNDKTRKIKTVLTLYVWVCLFIIPSEKNLNFNWDLSVNHSRDERFLIKDYYYYCY